MNLRIIAQYGSRISLAKSLYLSMRFGGKIIVGSGTRLQLTDKSRIEVSPGGVLYLGVKYNLPQPAVLEMWDDSVLRVTGKASINRGTKVVVGQGAQFSMGNDSFVNESSKVVCLKEVRIGANCTISWNVNIIDTDYHAVVLQGKEMERNGPIHIADDVWIGCGAIILKNTTIGAHSVIAAGAVVSKEVPAHSLWGGNPARQIKEEISWAR